MKNVLCVHPLQVFFDDRAHNIASGKVAGFHTVIASSFTVTTFALSIFLVETICPLQDCN
jgi:hypothetical protein